MSDDLVPLPPQIQGIPSPRDVGTMLVANLAVRVHNAREARGGVTQPEDVNALVRSLGGAKEMLEDYARAFTTAAQEAGHYLREEHLSAVGEQDGVPQSGLKVPDLDGTDIVFTLDQPNSHTVDQDQVIAVAINRRLELHRDTEPIQADDEPSYLYLERYEQWMFIVMRLAVADVLGVGTYTMQVSKARAFAAQLAGEGRDAAAAVVRGAINTTTRYRGVKVERRERKKP